MPFTINMSEAVTVTGTPRIAIDVGGTTRYATYTSGSGTAALTFTYTVQAGDEDSNGITLSSPIDLNGGTIKDLANNDASLSFTVPNTSGIIITSAVPTGYTVAFTADTVTNVNKTALAFTLTSPTLNRTYNYSITSSGGGTPVTGTGVNTVSPQTVSGIDVTSLPDGILTLSLTLGTGAAQGAAVTDTIPMAVLNGNLVGHWTFDTNDVSGGTAFDRSGQNRNGTIAGGAGTTTGMTGTALNFDGTNDLVSVTGLSVDATTAGAKTTVSFWMQWAGVNTRMPMSWGSFNYDLFFHSGGFGFNTYNSDVYGIPNAGMSGSWFHVVAEFNNGPATASRLWLNGVAQTISQQVGTSLSKNVATSMAIGGGGEANYFFSSKIDDFRVYNTTLTPSQISSLYNNH